MTDRKSIILGPLNVAGLGLEVAPYFNPLVLKKEYNVDYADYVSTEELRAKAALNPGAKNSEVPAIDYVWIPGKPLRSCIPNRKCYDYAVASHVVEHVPNVIGWLNDILVVMKNGATLALCVPDKRYSMDHYRRETTLGQLIGAWIEDRAIPTPSQVFDFLSQTYYDLGKRPAPYELGIDFEKVERHYSDLKALEYAFWTHNEKAYLDTHCTVWNPENFQKLFARLIEMKIMNVSMSEPVESAARGEFIVHLTKLGEPETVRPASTRAIE